MTPVRRLIWWRREEKAVSALTKIVKKAKDAFLVESAVEALGRLRHCGDFRRSRRDSPFKFACARESARCPEES